MNAINLFKYYNFFNFLDYLKTFNYLNFNNNSLIKVKVKIINTFYKKELKSDKKLYIKKEFV